MIFLEHVLYKQNLVISHLNKCYVKFMQSNNIE